MRNRYVLISKPNEKLLFDDIFRDSQNGGKYSKSIKDAMDTLFATGNTKFWNGTGNQFLYMALGYMGVNIVCNDKCHSYNRFTKTWNVEKQTKSVEYITIDNLKKLNLFNNKYTFDIVSTSFMGDKRYQVTHTTKEACPVVDYIKNRDKQKHKKQRVSEDVFSKYIKNNTKQNTKDDMER